MFRTDARPVMAFDPPARELASVRTCATEAVRVSVPPFLTQIQSNVISGSDNVTVPPGSTVIVSPASGPVRSLQAAPPFHLAPWAVSHRDAQEQSAASAKAGIARIATAATAARWMRLRHAMKGRP